MLTLVTLKYREMDPEDRVKLIKLFRCYSGLGLKESKEVITNDVGFLVPLSLAKGLNLNFEVHRLKENNK